MAEIEIPNLTLAYLVLETKEFIAESFLNKVQELENGWLKVKLNNQKFGSKDLVISPNAFFLTNYSIPAKMQTSGFGAFLRKQLDNRKILNINQHGFDRVVELEFNDNYLILELFSKGNIVLTDKKYEILAVKRKEEWKDRVLKKGEIYRFPASKGKNPDKVALQELEEILKGENSVVVSLIKGMNISPIIAEEVCFEAKVEKETISNSLKKKEIEKIYKLIQGFYSGISGKKLKPAIVETERSKIILPFEIKSQKGQKTITKINDFLDENLSKNTTQSQSAKENAASQSKKLKEMEYSIEEQKKAIISIGAQENGIEENQKKGEQVYQHYVELKNLFEAINRGKGLKLSEKEIFDKVKKVFPKIVSLDLKNSKVKVNFD